MRRVVVTGLGVVSSIGIGTQAFWTHLLEGQHGFKTLQSFDASAYRVRIGGEIQGFRFEDHEPALAVPLGRAAQFAVLAAKQALEDCGLLGHAEGHRGGVVMGTTSGEPNQVERYNDAQLADRLDLIDGSFMSTYPCNRLPEEVAQRFMLTGTAPVMIPAACAAGNYAIAHAADLLRAGCVDYMLAGGSDAFSRITYTGFHRLGAIAPDLCRPFDRNRQGMIPGEGAAFLVLEDEQRARKRGAHIYAELAGYGLSCDAFHMTGGHPEAHGAVAAMARALAEAGLETTAVDYISAHGTGTPSNDRNEVHAVERVFGADTRVPLSSIKSMLGHTMGAASAIEALVCALAVERDLIPPTMHFEESDPGCTLDFVPGAARQHQVRVAMSNAYAFGGANASIILKKHGGAP